MSLVVAHAVPDLLLFTMVTFGVVFAIYGILKIFEFFGEEVIRWLKAIS